MKLEKILVMAWGKTVSGDSYLEQEIKFPKEVPVEIELYENKTTGNATNFKNTPKGVICDIEIDKTIDVILEQLNKGMEIKKLILANKPVCKKKDKKKECENKLFTDENSLLLSEEQIKMLKNNKYFKDFENKSGDVLTTDIWTEAYKKADKIKVIDEFEPNQASLNKNGFSVDGVIKKSHYEDKKEELKILDDLNTLKDLEGLQGNINPSDWINKPELKIKAIKWIKKMLKRARANYKYLGKFEDWNITFRSWTNLDKEPMTPSDRNLFMAVWIKHFFGITDEDLK